MRCIYLHIQTTHSNNRNQMIQTKDTFKRISLAYFIGKEIDKYSSFQEPIIH